MSLTLWAITVVGILLLIALDFVMVSRKPHEVKFREAALWSVFYVGVAIAFGIALIVWQGSAVGTEYFAAYLVEKSLSVDNLFVFIIILAQFAVPTALHQRVLLFGVVLALIFRAIFIAIGAAAISAFAFTFVIFGAILIWTGIQLARHRNEDPDPMDNFIIRRVRSRVPFTDEYDGTRMFTKVDARRVATPLLLVMISIGATDLLFALDS
ncbi:MAG: TerC family protein, partial [Candidatus Nanopelagicales bacterium]